MYFAPLQTLKPGYGPAFMGNVASLPPSVAVNFQAKPSPVLLRHNSRPSELNRWVELIFYSD